MPAPLHLIAAIAPPPRLFRMMWVSWLVATTVSIPLDSLAVDIGVARVDVTPTEPIRLTGYAARKSPHVGVEQKLWAKALAIGADREGPAVLLTLDNCGIAEDTWREVRSRLAKSARIRPESIVVASSHTHSGPATRNWAPNIFVRDLTPEEQGAIDRYTDRLISQLEGVALDALKNRRPGRLGWSQGTAAFAANRRTRGGPVDHALPVIKAETLEGKLLALVANYACHCTTLGGEFNHVCGDWAGYAQEFIERESPEAVALVTIGCGADANPSPRGGADGGLAFARKHGEEIAAEVKRLLGLTFTPLEVRLQAAAREIALPFGPHFTRDQWLARSTNAGIVGYHAKKWLGRLDRGAKLPESLYYPVTTWSFGDQLALVFLPGEVVVDYALRLKREFDGRRLWVSGYANYVPCYIPSRRILAEGGYEAEDSLWYYDRPARISTNAEDLIVRTVHDLLPGAFRSDPRKAEIPDAKTPREALGSFRLPAELAIELVASEPLVASPVAIDWDAQGRLWVCEMFDYPAGLNPPADTGRKYGEPLKEPPGGFTPGGRIKVLTDTNGDGRFDQATTFIDRIPFPTGITPWGKGAIICAAPNILYAEDTNGDGRADLLRTNVTGFATHNYQARVNGFVWGLDGWLHGSSGLFGGKVRSLQTGREVDLSGRDFRYRPDTGEIEPVSGISQYGRVRDEFDNWFGNDNSTLLWHYPVPDHYLRRNTHVTHPEPRLLVGRGTGLNKLFPISQTLERFNDPQMANIVTSACGPEIYRDDLLGSNYHGNAFVCEPVHNLVRRLQLTSEGVTFAGKKPAGEERGEFLASTDNWFRPVQARTGPDGALYIVDMYRFVVEHPRWIPPDRLAKLDVRAGADLGRIYRIVPKGTHLRPTVLAADSELMLAERLDTPNGPTRDLVQRKWNEGGPSTKGSGNLAAAIKVLHRHATGAGVAAVRAQAMAMLGQRNLLSPELIGQGLGDSNREVRKITARLAEPSLQGAAAEPVGKLLASRLVTETDPAVRLQLALSLGAWNDARATAALLRVNGVEDRWMRAAVLSSAGSRPGEYLQEVSRTEVPARTREALVGPLIATAVATGATTDLVFAVRSLVASDPVSAGGGGIEPWRLDALGNLFRALRRKGSEAERFHEKLAASHPDVSRQIEALIKSAAQWVTRADAPEAQRLAAIRLLGAWDQVTTGEILFRDVLKAHAGPALEVAAVEALAMSPRSEVAERLVQSWNDLSPGVRRRALDALLNRAEWTGALLGALEKGSIQSGEVGTEQRQRLLKARDSALRDRAAKIFASSGGTSRMEALSKFQAVPSLAGVADRGGAIFDKSCAQCHRLRGRGFDVGPNLAEFAGKSVQDFILAILDPNAGINPSFVAYNIETKDGRTLTGLVRDETAGNLTLVQGGGVKETILRGEVTSIRAGALSLMPEGLEEAMSPQDLADLIAWIKGGAPALFGSATPEQSSRARADFQKAGVLGLSEVVTSVERLPYPSWLGRLPLAYCRQNAGQERLVWKTGIIQQTTDRVTFRFPAAMGFASQPAGRFTLKLNGRPLIDFDVTLADRAWESAEGKCRIEYSVKEANSEDSNGVLVIDVASSLLAAGKPAEFEVTGSPNNSQRWFGVYVMDQALNARK